MTLDDQIILAKQRVRKLMKLRRLTIAANSMQSGDIAHRYTNRAMSVVCRVFGIPKADLLSPSRMQHIADARFACFYLLRKKTRLTLDTIRIAFGKKDHGTVLNGANRVEHFISCDREFASKIKQCVEMFEGE